MFDVLESIKTRDVIPLGSAFPSPLLFPLPRLSRSMASSVQEMDPWSTVEDLTPGNASLRRQIALRYLADGLHLHTDEIVITNGALEALNLCLQAVARPGDCIIIESPTFYAALQALERIGLNAIEVPTHPREGIDLEALALALERHKPKACWLMTNFQIPGNQCCTWPHVLGAPWVHQLPSPELWPSVECKNGGSAGHVRADSLRGHGRKEQ